MVRAQYGPTQIPCCAGGGIQSHGEVSDYDERMGTIRSSLRLGIAEGVTPTTWIRRWSHRLPEVELDLVMFNAVAGMAEVRAGSIDAGILRPPQHAEGLHVIPLYEERAVVIAPKDHYLAAADEVNVADLDGEVVHDVADAVRWPVPIGTPAAQSQPTTRDAIQLVAAGVGILVVPHSLARLHARKDLMHRPVADLPLTPVGLVWRNDDDSPLIEELIGIVRGRTAGSTRGQPSAASVKRTAAQKAAARREYLAKQRAERGAPRTRGKGRRR